MTQAVKPLDPAIALALAPFSPPDSEAQRVAADIAINRMKQTGQIWRDEVERAHWIEVQHGVHE